MRRSMISPQLSRQLTELAALEAAAIAATGQGEEGGDEPAVPLPMDEAAPLPGEAVSVADEAVENDAPPPEVGPPVTAPAEAQAEPPHRSDPSSLGGVGHARIEDDEEEAMPAEQQQAFAEGVDEDEPPPPFLFESEDAPPPSLFEVVLRSPGTDVGRQIVLDVGEHGLAIKDPFGALLKVVPLEYVTGWKPEARELILVISKDLQKFHRMIVRCEGEETPLAIEAALAYYAEHRIAIAPPRLRGRSASSLSMSSFAEAFGIGFRSRSSLSMTTVDRV